MGVAGEVVQDLAGSSSRGPGIEVPLFFTKWGDEVGKSAGVVKVLEMAEEVQSPVAVEFEEHNPDHQIQYCPRLLPLPSALRRRV